MSDPTYRLLLDLAGRVDDDLLAAGRELVAVGEEGHALELVVAELVAGRTVLPPAVRSVLVAETAARRIQPDAARGLPAAGSTDGLPHRFTGDGPPEQTRELAAALAGASAPAGGWSLALRTTPAGAAPGPLPQPVLLGRAGGDESAEVLTYQAQSALGRAGLAAAVEVHDDGDPDTTYHRAAWAVARPLPAGPVASDDRPAGLLAGTGEPPTAAVHDGTPTTSGPAPQHTAGGPDQQLPAATTAGPPAPATHDVHVHDTAARPAEPSATSGLDALRPGTGADERHPATGTDDDLPARLHTAVGPDEPPTEAQPAIAGPHTTSVVTEQRPADRPDGRQPATGSPDQPEQGTGRPTEQQPADRPGTGQPATGSPDRPEQETDRPTRLLPTDGPAGPGATAPTGDGRPTEESASAPATAADRAAGEEPTGPEPTGAPDDETVGTAPQDSTGATRPDVAEQHAEQDLTTTVLPRRGPTDRTRELPFRDRTLRPGRSTSRARYANVTSLPGIVGPGDGTPPRRPRDTAAAPADAAEAGTPGPQADPAGPGSVDDHGAAAGAEPSPTGPMQPHTAGPTGTPADTASPDALSPDTGAPNPEQPGPGQPDSRPPSSGLPSSGLPDSGSPNRAQPDAEQPGSGGPGSGGPGLWPAAQDTPRPDGLQGRVTPLRTGSFPPPAPALNGVTDPTGPPEPGGPGGVPRDVEWGSAQTEQGPAAPDLFGTPPVRPGPEAGSDVSATGPGPHLPGPEGAPPSARGPAGTLPPTDTAADGTAPIPPVPPPPAPAPAGQDGPGPGMFDAVVPGPGGHRPAPGEGHTPAGPDDDPTGAGHPAPRPSPPIRALRRATGDWFDADDRPREAGPTGETPGAGPAPSPAGSAAPGAPQPAGGHGHARTGPGTADPPPGRPGVPAAAEDAWQQDWASGAWVGDVLPVAAPVPEGGPFPTADGAEIDAPTPPPGIPIAYAPPVPTSALPPAGPQGPRHLLLTEDSDAPGQDDTGYDDTDYGAAGYDDTGYGDTNYDAPSHDRSGHVDTGHVDTGHGDTGQADPGGADDGYSNDDRGGEGHGGASSGGVDVSGADSGAVPPAETPGEAPEIPRPTGGLADRLSPTEHDLLQRLHEELAARENGGEPTPRNGTARPDRN